MSVFSLETLSYRGAARIGAEILGLFFLFTVVFHVAQPFIHSIAPETFTQVGIDYSRTDLPNTSMEILHLTLGCLISGTFLYWRLYRTETGKKLIDQFEK